MFFTLIKEINRSSKEMNILLSKGTNILKKEIDGLLCRGINRLRKEINRLLSKEMSNICLKVTFEKNLTFSKLWFSRLKKLSPDQFLGSSNSRRYHWILNLLVVT